jgi:hypothetical protein
MKQLNRDQFNKAPEMIKYLYICMLEKMPVSTNTLELAMIKFPEYFNINKNEKCQTAEDLIKEYKERFTSLQDEDQSIFSKKPPEIISCDLTKEDIINLMIEIKTKMQ